MTSTIQFAFETAVPAAATAPANNRRSPVLRNILVRMAAFLVLVTASTTLMAVPYLGVDEDPGAGQAEYVSRLETAFQLADEVAAEPSLAEALLVRATKADRRAAMADCREQVWPHIGEGCLNTPAGRAVRTVTVERQLTASSSALVRLPLNNLASQESESGILVD